MVKSKDRRGDLRIPTFRTVLRMLRVGTGIKTSNSMRRAEAIKEITRLAGWLIDAKQLFTRCSSI